MADSRRDSSGGVGGRGGARKGAGWLCRCTQGCGCRCRCTQGCGRLRRCAQDADGSAGVGAGDSAGAGGGAEAGFGVGAGQAAGAGVFLCPATGEPCHTQRSTAFSTSPSRSRSRRGRAACCGSAFRRCCGRPESGPSQWPLLRRRRPAGRAREWPAREQPGRHDQGDVLILTPTEPGGTATGRLLVANDGDVALAGLKLVCVGLVADGGRRIDGRSLTTAPATLDLRARGHRLVELTLRVPDNTAAGNYTGVILAAGSPQIRSLVLVEVR